ncbi:MAG: gliding motility protein GldM [Saprospiraceae bacterium]|nr:gliding motility protein GldM [Saprospiraceae bacterium]
MSIPKEPRQLMINIMYLVLTAMLALNVSAEIINAFLSLDKGIKQTSSIVDTSNEVVMKNIEEQVKNNPKYGEYQTKAQQALTITSDFVSYVEGIRGKIFNAAGGPSEEDPTKPKDYKNKDVTTRMLVNEGMGTDLENKLKDTRSKLLALAGNDPALAASMPLNIEELPKNTDKKNWADFKFRQMPVAAVFPILSKIQNDAKTSSTAILNDIYKKIAVGDLKFDKFTPVLFAKKAYLLQGETYEAEVSVGAYSSQSAGNVSINVNGRSLPVKDGIAKYTETANSTGTRKINVNVNLKNPFTGETVNAKKEFEYEVGLPSVACSADKMNVFYIGVDNPITVSLAGASSNSLNVNGTGPISVSKASGNNKYTVVAKAPGDATISVSSGNIKGSFPFRVKRIPDPVAKLSQSNGGAMGNGEFKAQGGVSAVLENFDFDAKCQIQGFNLTRAPRREDPVSKENAGGRYAGDVQRLIDMAKPGDTYYFENVKARCPGDPAGRKINDMVFKIK